MSARSTHVLKEALHRCWLTRRRLEERQVSLHTCRQEAPIGEPQRLGGVTRDAQQGLLHREAGDQGREGRSGPDVVYGTRAWIQVGTHSDGYTGFSECFNWGGLHP